VTRDNNYAMQYRAAIIFASVPSQHTLLDAAVPGGGTSRAAMFLKIHLRRKLL
jgi:hypothetical protein